MRMELDRSGGRPLPLQIAETLGHRIASGLLTPGAVLPSIRTLARTLGVSQVTISKAYAELERAGWIERRHGAGCYVRQSLRPADRALREGGQERLADRTRGRGPGWLDDRGSSGRESEAADGQTGRGGNRASAEGEVVGGNHAAAAEPGSRRKGGAADRGLAGADRQRAVARRSAPEEAEPSLGFGGMGTNRKRPGTAEGSVPPGLEPVAGRRSDSRNMSTRRGASSRPVLPARYDWQEALDDYLPRAQLWRNFDDREVRYPLHLAAIHAELLPLRELGDAMAKLVTEQPELMSAYGNFQGDYELRSVMARHLRQRGVAAEPEGVLVTSGAQQGIDLVARTFVGPGDTVYLEDPSYTGAIDVFAGRGARMAFVPTDGNGMRIDALLRMCDERPPKLIYTVPTYQNPSGVTLGPERRRQLLELARAYGSLILEDDPFSDLYFASPPPPPVKSLDREGHVLYLKSFSKMLAPGCRLACLAADGDVLTRLIAAKSASDLGSPLLTQRALLPFIAGRYDAYAAGLRAALRRRMKQAARILAEFAPPGVRWTAPQGGLSLWLELPRPLDTAALAADAADVGVTFLPGGVCRAGDARSSHIRICYSILGEADTERALGLLLPLLAEHVKRG